jgi:peptide deformylase
VKVRAQDASGESIEVEAEGLEARVIQHEIDHLGGVLILDRISREARKEAMRAMREAQEPIEERPASAA